ncbi:Acetophenone carboxylase gamma subunit [bacterium HR37]|nr:Acetophenone carboxylase gamma subunit [bacterium HR37]
MKGSLRVGVDTGGTFTDFVLIDGEKVVTHKVLSTPSDPSRAVIKGLFELLGEVRDIEVIHGTTVATNTLLERKGACVALLTTKGFEDVIEIGRQNREKLYDIFWERPKPLVAREFRLGVRERVSFDGKVLEEVALDDLRRIYGKLKRLKVDCIAISFLHSYANPLNEERAESFLSSLGIPISTSSKLVPEFREYERTSTVVANSYLLPRVSLYMKNLEDELSGCRVSVMQSSGGLISPEQAAKEPVRILLSGPAGGVVGGFRIAEAMGYSKVITYDMGGTSTDVALCDGSLRFTTETVIDGVPIKIPMVDVVSIGAGGGSIAYFDAGGALKVGPISAGADPGPACYGRGEFVTVTDANVVLGRILPDWFLGGKMRIFPERAFFAFKKLLSGREIPLKELAEGVIRVANANMERALRVVSVERGFDPRDFALLSFGGAGGLHACELAAGLGIKTVIFPKNPGVLSALGMLMADSFKDYSLTTFFTSKRLSKESLERSFRVLEERAYRDFRATRIRFERFVDARYRRQSHEITIPYCKDVVSAFHRAHRRLYGYAKPDSEVEIVTLRVRAIERRGRIELPLLNKAAGEVRFRKERVFFKGSEIELKCYIREDFFSGFKFQGPALVVEDTSTLFIPPEFRCEVDDWGHIIARV